MSEDLHRTMRIAQIVPEGVVGATLILYGDLPAEPGQFVMVWLPGVGERPFTLMDDAPVSLSVAAIGPFTRALCALRAGDRVWIRGPFGRGFASLADHAPGARSLLIGAGSGTASLALLAKVARSRGEEVTAVVAARSSQALMLPWRFAGLGCVMLTATDDGSRGQRGTALDAAAPLLASRWPDRVYACGPEPMLAALARSCLDLELRCWVAMERVIKCGIGVCGHCHCGELIVCHDGPVVGAEALLQALERRESQG